MTAAEFKLAASAHQRHGWRFAPAPAKVNLGLRITGRRADGYHLLDSLVVFAGIGDIIGLRPAENGTTTLCLRGPYAVDLDQASNDNLATQAAEAFRRTFGGPAVNIILWKHLPLAAGIGGGSADAAAVLRLMAELVSERPSPDALSNLALGLGADLPMCLSGRPIRIGGIGEIMSPLRNLPDVPAVLCNPGVQCPTPAVFKARTGAFSLPGGIPDRISTPKELAEIAAEFGNDLAAPAIATTPEIQHCLDSVSQTDRSIGHGMSGSGATCFGLYRSNEAARTAAAAIANRFPNWWVRATQLYGS